MMRELFRIPGIDLPVFGYGAMLVIGLLVAVWVAGRMARRVGLDPELFVNAGILALVAGIVGARLSHVLENLDLYTNPQRSFAQNLFAAVNIRSGGLTYYGGFLLAFPTLVIYALRHRMPLRLSMDIVAPALMIGLGFGRLGCLLNGCCWGEECNLPWGVRYPFGSYAYVEEYEHGHQHPPAELLGTPRADDQRPPLLSDQQIAADPHLSALAADQHSLARHPVQVYTTIMAFLIAGISIAWFSLGAPPGRGFALMLMLEGVTRFVLETLRVEPAVIGNFSYSMVIACGLVGLGIGLWFAFSRPADNSPPPLPTPA
jgi:phosphatidylglycerol:prolipoprotein diacylglycerol transferase